MKRTAFLLLLLVIVPIVLFASAESTLTHYIPELEVSVDIPFGIVCVSRESDQTNSFFQNEYFDYATVHQYMLDNNFFLYGMTVDLMGEFALIGTDYEDEEFNSMDSMTLSILGNQLKNSMSAQGAIDVKYDVYQGEKDKAIRLHYTYKMQPADQYVLFYYTTHGSKLLSIRFISFNSKISDDQENMIQRLFDSLVWEKKTYSLEPKGETNMNIYSDNETGLTFMVPSGWNEVKFVAGEESKKVKYRIGSDNTWVLYESGDMWDVIIQSYGDLLKTYGITRKEIGNEFLSKEIVATTLGCSEDDISMKTIGGQDYYCMNKISTYNIGNMTFNNQDIVYMCMHNAYLYWFQLSGTEAEKYENQFNRFMRTIEFP